MRFICWVAVLGVGAVLLVGCGDEGGAETAEKPPQSQRHPEPQQRPQPQKKLRGLEITLDGLPSPENVGVWMAKKRGYLEAAGIDLSIHSPVGPSLPIQYVRDGAVELALSHMPQVVLAKERGARILALRSVVPRPTAAMIWLEQSKLDDLADLKGKTIAIPGVPFQEELLRSVLEDAGLTLNDVEVKKVEYLLVEALASGRADAIFGGSWNVEGVELESRGLEPVVTRLPELGVPGYEELVLITRQDHLAKSPDLLRDFLTALARGTAAAIEDPEEAAEAIAEQTLEPNLKAIEAGVDATLPLLSRDGRMSTGEARRLVDWMFEQGMIQRKIPASALFTNSYLPAGP